MSECYGCKQPGGVIETLSGVKWHDHCLRAAQAKTISDLRAEEEAKEAAEAEAETVDSLRQAIATMEAERRAEVAWLVAALDSAQADLARQRQANAIAGQTVASWEAQAKQMERERDALQGEVDALTKVLCAANEAGTEWAQRAERLRAFIKENQSAGFTVSGKRVFWCIGCGRRSGDSHAPDCELVVLLEGSK